MSSSLPDRCLQQINELQQQDHLHPQNARPLAMHPDKHDNTVPNALEYLQVFLQTSVLPVELHDKQKPDFLLYQAKFLMVVMIAAQLETVPEFNHLIFPKQYSKPQI